MRNRPCSTARDCHFTKYSGCLEAKAKAGMSYSWRSIMRGIELLKKGIIWRVGDGDNLKIWSDPWLPHDWTRKPCTPRGSNLLRYVSELIDPMSGQWDAELVRDIFYEEDANVILALPVHEGRENTVAWHFDQHGLFSVKSAYKLCRDDILRLRTKGQGSSSRSPSTAEESMWKRIWSMKCPAKLKHFAWRCASNSHPLRINLKLRGMKIDTKRVVCQRLDEDGAHLYFKCKKVKELWCSLNLNKERATMAEMESAKEVFEFILSLREEMKLKCLITMWTWWTERNRIREGEQRRTTTGLKQSINAYLAEVVKLNEKETKPMYKVKQRWSKPEGEFIKVNCDASFSPSDRSGGWGYIIRDQDGDVVSAGRGRIMYLLNAFHAELIACLQGAQAAITLGIGNIILEIDALKVQQAVETDAYGSTAVGILIDELKELLSLNFLSAVVQYKPRECNRVAHALAALGCECNLEDDPVLEVLPLCIRVMVTDDLSVSG